MTLNEIKFQGNPPKIVPLKYSKIDNKSEKIRIELKFILISKNFIKYENSPQNKDNKKGINKMDKKIKFSKFSSNFNELETQYKFDKKYPNPYIQPITKLLSKFLLILFTKV